MTAEHGQPRRGDFKEFLRSGPDGDALDIDRSAEPARAVDFGEDGELPYSGQAQRS